MNWFTAHAPIRLKLLIAFGAMVALVAVQPLASLIAGPSSVFVVGLGATAVAAVLGFVFRNAIATPYVTTVLRMEALAKGDLASTIQFTDYRDCVGRMTKAMFAFRDSAQAQIALNAEAEKHACLVRGMTSNFKRLADGDLTADIVEDYPAEYAPLKAAFNEALNGLRALIGSVTQSAETIRAGSSEIAGASESLARRTEANAASLEETSAAIAQIDGRLKSNAAAAKRTVERADGAISTVGSGRSVTGEAVQAMSRVSESAKGIDDVIEGLDKIAFQTRVLAMNAAVEAGRAGEAGRGFAVVADLVSALAMRAEEEAKRAREQLTVTQSEVLTAVEMVQRVDGALAAISGDVDEVHALLSEMASDNQAQAQAISQITGSVGTMDTATQQNAAMVEETSAAARNLDVEVNMLADQAARFRTGAGDMPTRAAARPARPALSLH
ncbi:methyl-accepting chemotaxis protein [Sphingomonas sp. HF-S4]|uniref:Methyl-accepting chemotaxis protein n=1 Tax=Sphingomonas agrestis TaxID=3080540 RepID=A0ABU3Y4Z1_9SPHN|nr:methyl-accepting chemotaxis protein [Sphingomonas sp. HF-S4]MDV3456132.1 methyl-accepting chemotaxis protein [Sphingomonas sp. HF-S4]